MGLAQGSGRSPGQLSRRAFVAAAASAAAKSAAAQRPIRIGAPVFVNSDDPQELAREHRRLGYSAAYCPDASVSDRERTEAIRKAFSDSDVAIAEVGAWKNMLDPNPETRRDNLRYVVERLALAEAVDARCCVNIAGSYDAEVWYGPHPQNLTEEAFDATVENCRKVIDEVRPTRTKFSIEMMGWVWPDSPDAYLRLIRAVDREAFGVHIDVCNIVNSPRRFYGNAELIRECFRKLGRWAVSCHAKDLAWKVELNVHFVEVIPGRGQIDYRTYLSELSGAPVEAPLMIEHLKGPEQYLEAFNYIKRVGSEVGVGFL